MCLPIETIAASGSPAVVHYEWDPETELLAAQVRHLSPAPARSVSEAPSRAFGSVEIQGHDGSWITLDLSRNRIEGAAIAAWPHLVRRRWLAPPDRAEHVHAVVNLSRSESATALEVVTNLTAEVDDSTHTVHLSLLRHRAAGDHRSSRVRSVRIARDILLDVDGKRRLAGLWLLNVPPDSIPVP
jgi:hypothetical protein